METSRKLVKDFTLARGWEKQLPDHVAKSISIEAAELLEIFQWSSPSFTEVKADKQKMEEIKGELADVLIYCIQMALILNLDIDEIIAKKLAFANKKYPAHLMKQRSDTESHATEVYLKIKKAYRKNRK